MVLRASRRKLQDPAQPRGEYTSPSQGTEGSYSIGPPLDQDRFGQVPQRLGLQAGYREQRFAEELRQLHGRALAH
ncbi:hypothetical protein D3C86_1273670 [compost metagenome]